MVNLPAPPGPYTLEQFVKQLDELFSNLSLSQAHLVGFSMGGMVAQAYAIRYPEKVSSLTIMSSVAKRSEEQRQGVLARVKEVEKQGHKATITAAIQRWFNKPFMEKHPEVVTQIQQRLEKQSTECLLISLPCVRYSG
ncbi:hypothetical protein GCM10020331_087710 [Ectobacillus funiculus]